MPREVAVVSTLPRRVAEPALEERRTGIVVTALEQRVRDRMSDVAASRLEGIRALRQTERLRAVVQLAVCKRVRAEEPGVGAILRRQLGHQRESLFLSVSLAAGVQKEVRLAQQKRVPRKLAHMLANEVVCRSGITLDGRRK